MDNIDKSTNQRFTSRLGLLLSVLGIAVGTGNIWRFPRIAAQCGGEEGAGSFLIAWLCFLFLWSIPLIIAEYALGRKNRSGVLSTVARSAGKKFTWMGGFIGFVSTAIMFFYSVIVGWCVYYFIYMLTNPLPMTTAASMQIWESYQSGGWPILFHAIAIGIGALVIWKGINSIEKINKFLIPSLLLIVILSVIRAITLPGSLDGIKYLFTPQWEQLQNPAIWLEALTQNAWDTGAGWGLFMTYAAYMKKKHGIVKNAFTTGIGNNIISILAALMIFGTVFSVSQTELHMNRTQILDIMKTSGPASTGLTFIWMPQLFARMFLGHPLAVLFFLGLTFAGFSSLISMLELPTRIFIDAGYKRNHAITLIVTVSFILGIPSAVNLNFLSNQDFVWGLGLMLSGALVAFSIVRQGAKNIRKNILLQDKNDLQIGTWWDKVLTYFIPLGAFILLVWWFSLAASTKKWYDPFQSFSFMTCIFQWSIVLGLLKYYNKQITIKMVKFEF
ncbi:MAG: sodium-dependent transporter [Candidatus Marinimicrobia bacterium]|nr:sodium-dependent transporter [Candidatus Neomarinimicrobiota bacterium]